MKRKMLSTFLLEYDRCNCLPSGVYIDQKGNIRGVVNAPPPRRFISLAGGRDKSRFFALDVKGNVYNGHTADYIQQFAKNRYPFKNIWCHSQDGKLFLVARTLDNWVYVALTTDRHPYIISAKIPFKVAAFASDPQTSLWFLDEKGRVRAFSLNVHPLYVIQEPSFSLARNPAEYRQIPLDQCVKFFVHKGRPCYLSKDSVFYRLSKSGEWSVVLNVFDVTLGGQVILFHKGIRRVQWIDEPGRKRPWAYFEDGQEGTVRDLIEGEQCCFIDCNGNWIDFGPRGQKILHHLQPPPSFRYRVRALTRVIHTIRGTKRNPYPIGGLPPEIWEREIFPLLRRAELK